MDRFDDEIETLAEAVIGAAIEVHRHLGPGHTEAVYGNALSLELKRRDLRQQREYAFKVQYKGDCVGEGRVDFLVGGRLVVEIKAVRGIDDAHVAQTLFYLANVKSPLGLIINFNVTLLKNGIRRVVDRRFA